jgi:membrane protein
MDQFIRLPLVQGIKVKLRKVQLPGSDNQVSLWDTGLFLIREIMNPSFNVRAGAMAFNFFFALFPGLIFLITLLPIIPVPNLKEELLTYLYTYLPEQSYAMIVETIEDTFTRNNNSIISLSVFLVLYSTTRGVSVMMLAFDRDLPGFKHRSFLSTQLLSLGLIVLLSLFFLLALSITIIAEIWVGYLPLEQLSFPNISVWAIRLLDIFMTLLMLLIAFGIIYKFVPCKEQKFKFWSAGAFAGSILAMLATLAFGIFVANFSNYNKIYGSISAIIMLMVWMYWISMVILIGFELNLAIERATQKGLTKLEVSFKAASFLKRKTYQDQDTHNE